MGPFIFFFIIRKIIASRGINENTENIYTQWLAVYYNFLLQIAVIL